MIEVVLPETIDLNNAVLEWRNLTIRSEAPELDLAHDVLERHLLAGELLDAELGLGLILANTLGLPGAVVQDRDGKENWVVVNKEGYLIGDRKELVPSKWYPVRRDWVRPMVMLEMLRTNMFGRDIDWD